MTPPHSTESDIPIADPPLVLVSDGIKSIYVNWQGPPLPDDLSGSFSCSGQVVRSVLTGRHESISAIARAEIGNPDSDYAVKFSPMAKGQARLEVARVTPAAEQAGRPLASITLPDGTKLDFDKAESTEPENPWLADLRKETKQ